MLTAGSIYVAGACIGALIFGQLTDRWGRKKLFMATLLLYLVATVATAFTSSAALFFVCRFFTGAGIGGEYAAINSAIDELIPARVRGRVDLIINGSYWLGAALGALGAYFLLSDAIPADVGWRLAFGFGAILGIGILLVRRHVPESPRWLFIHGREEEAERIVGSIEQEVREETGEELEEPGSSIKVRQRHTISLREVARTAFKTLPAALRARPGAVRRPGLHLQLRDLRPGHVPGRVLRHRRRQGPALPRAVRGLQLRSARCCSGRLFDTVGRKPMIAGTYIGSAVVLVILTVLFTSDTLGVWGFMALLLATFFLASAGASSAYLTVSEIFPMETRALAIAFFYAIGTAIGGITGPYIFGKMIESGEESQVAIAFFLGAGVMAIGGVAELVFGVKAEKAELEDIAKPLTAEDAEQEEDEPRAKPEPAAAGRREHARRYRLGPGRDLVLARHGRLRAGHRAGVLPRDRAHRVGAGRARHARAARAGAARRRPLLGPGTLPGRAARGRAGGQGAAPRPHALRAGLAGQRRVHDEAGEHHAPGDDGEQPDVPARDRPPAPARRPAGRARRR